jgi:EAL domain-containing protein (putative c-di-GMP-specific phosphodiesterase class I)
MKDKQEFVLFYQPIVDLVTSKLVGFEALIRWNHPKKGIISPNVFLPKIEELGLSEELGSWVLRQAMSDFRTFITDKNKDLYMSINLSSPQIVQNRLPEEIIGLLMEMDIPPHQIQLEITETSLMKNPQLAEKVMRRIQAEGCRIAIDDFGSGYSSLSYLQLFPITCIKIDRSFIHNLHTKHQNREIVRMVLALGQTIQASVTAEGIETQEEWDELIKLGCAYGQGYLFGKPNPDIEHFNHLLVDRDTQKDRLSA